jgi:hypothetical protein
MHMQNEKKSLFYFPFIYLDRLLVSIKNNK